MNPKDARRFEMGVAPSPPPFTVSQHNALMVEEAARELTPPAGGWIRECAWMAAHAKTDEDREWWLNELEVAGYDRT